VGLPLSEAIRAEPNCAIDLVEDLILENDPIVQMGVVSDGVSSSMNSSTGFLVAPKDPVDIVQAMKDSGAELIISYLPVGSTEATNVYANSALLAGCSYINCVPVSVSRNELFSKRFADAGLHIFGDDIKSQIGATITHQRLVELFVQRGVILRDSFQLNIGGNTDFKNMLDQNRLKDKRASKTDAVVRRSGAQISADKLRVGPSDYVGYLNDEKRAFIEIRGNGFAHAPVSLRVELSVQDSPNSAACVIDLIRFSRCVGLGDTQIHAAIETFYMKSPRNDIGDEQAYKILSHFAGKFAS
jgi:myo-inositol-1-phosphate synthase